jgi:hypothetical protein
VESGYAGLLVAAGVRREHLGLASVASRLGVLAAALAAWGAAAQAGSLALGRGLDGPLAVHTLASIETLAIPLVAAAAASALVAPAAAGIAGAATYVLAQAVVNLKAAADAGIIGDVAAPAIRAAFAFLPRAVVSPLISDLQARDRARLAAPRFEINEIVVTIPPAGVGTILWTLLWTAILGGLAVGALRRRAL